MRLHLLNICNASYLPVTIPFHQALGIMASCSCNPLQARVLQFCFEIAGHKNTLLFIFS